MYLPQHFEETRVAVLHELMSTHPFAVLITACADGLDANHLPFVLAPDPSPLGTLQAHIAKANTLRDQQLDLDALVVFQGPQAYVSPGWYPSKQETGNAVPTWNYVVVHARGPLKFIEDPDWLRKHLEKLTHAHEGARPAPWKLEDSSEGFINRLMHGIVGIEIPLTSLTGKWKLSQNRSAKDRAGVIAGLEQEDKAEALALAQFMKHEKS